MNLAKKIIALSLSATTAALCLPSTAIAAATSGPRTDEYTVARAVIENGRVAMNYLQKSDPVYSAAGYKRSSALKKYDLRDGNRATGVKQQGGYGACWAFGALSSLESNLLTRENADSGIALSPRHLAWFTYNGKDDGADKSAYAGGDTFYAADAYQSGGSRWVSIPTLARRYGAADETDAPYSASGMAAVDSAKRTISKTALSGAEFLPETTEAIYSDSGELESQTLSSGFSSALAEIKESIIDNGAISVGYYAGDDYYNSKTYGYYYNASKKIGSGRWQIANHEVSVIGWDDDYPASNFGEKPGGDGAWIVKNSWGDSWGDNGYFYMSYYDLSFSEPTAFIAENSEYSASGSDHEYDDVYQYDGTGSGFTFASSSEKIEYANLFTARGDELIGAVSTFALMPNSTLGYKIYKNPSQSATPSSGTLEASGRVTFKNGGYKTVELGKQAVDVLKGEQYAVVIELSYLSEGKRYYQKMLESQYDEDVIGNRVECGKGQSFFKRASARLWTDAAESKTPGNAVVKAFTNELYVPDKNEVSAAAITYGSPLSDSKITGDSITRDGKALKGSFEWKDKSEVLNAGTASCVAVFTPDNSEEPAVNVLISVEVKKRPLVYKLNDFKRSRGAANPAFTAELVSGEPVAGDSVKITAFCAATAASPPGVYEITGSAQSGNYSVVVKSGTLTVEAVKVPAAIIKITSAPKILGVGKKKQIKTSVSPSGTKVSWKTGNGSVAAVSSSGVVTAKSPGRVKIIATAGSASASVTINVNPGAVRKLKVTVKRGRKARVSFAKGRGGKYTQIVIKKGKGKFKTLSKTTASAITKRLKRGSYKIKARSYKKVGKSAYYGAYCRAKSFRIK